MPTSRKPSSGAPASWLADGGALFEIGMADGVKSTLVGAGTQIGPYRLIEKIGEGGLGIVWRAAQTEPIQREAAIKLTKAELHFRSDVITRFDLERQALARMSHPNIAAILDAGTLPDERPYFVMELVRGVPLTTFCNQRKLDVRARIELFVAICHAVHHAHQKGILHRDLKPSNILVAEQDGQHVPKIIDFGIAKALDDTDPALHSVFFKTQPGDLPAATYQYMSPEQAGRGVTDIDTRSDIYTLGVLLYELLTGKLPLPDDLARRGNFDEIASHVREVDPTRPSERLTDAGTKTPALRGDLDWIVLRALEKNRDRRYESAAALAGDLQRHLAHEPVSAGPPGALYRCSKWVRRHRVAFASIAAVALSLIIGLVSTWLALQRERLALEREATQRALAEQHEREALAAHAEESRARQAAEASRRIADVARGRAELLINDILYDLRDKLEPVGKVPLLEQVSRTAQAYFESVPPSDDNDAQQRNRAAMLQNRGSILLAKGEAKAALGIFQQSLTIVQARAKTKPANVQCLHDLAIAHERCGAAEEQLGNDDDASRCYEQMLRVFEHLKATAKPDAWAGDHAVAHEHLGDLARKHGQQELALTQYQRGIDSLDALTPDDIVRRRRAVLEGKLGAVDAEHAAEHYTRELAAWTELRRANAEDTSLLASEAIAHGHLAGVLKTKESLEHAQLQADAFAKLTVLDPLNFVWQRERETAVHQLGVSQEACGDAGKALSSYLQAIGLAAKLPGGQRAEASAHLRLAALLFRLNREPEAREHATATLTLLGGSKDAEATAWRATAQELAR